jgi:hypothetical protein
MAKKKQPARLAATEPNRPYNLAGRQADDSGLGDRLFIRMPPLMLADIKFLAELEGRPVANMARHMLEVGLHYYRDRHSEPFKTHRETQARLMRTLERK